MMSNKVSLLTKFRYWRQRMFDPQFQWGHPEDWDDAEWYYYYKEVKK